MPIVIKKKTYQWFRQLKIFKATPIYSSAESALVEVPYDEQIYLENGFLIGRALRKVIQTSHPYQMQLLKVRKIAVLKTSQNWQIIQPVLTQIGFPILERQEGEIMSISETIISEILQYLMDEYGPPDIEPKQKQRKRHLFIDTAQFFSEKPINEAENSLQLMCIVLTNTLDIELNEALGLLINNCEYLKQVVKEGSQKDGFEGIERTYDTIIQNWQIAQELMIYEGKGYHKFLMGLKEGILSQSMQIVLKTLKMLDKVKSNDWFVSDGYYTFLESQHPIVFQYFIKHIEPNYSRILNQNLHLIIKDQRQLFAILLNLLSQIKKTIYSKQLMDSMPISYFLQQSFTILDPQVIDEHDGTLKQLARELLTRVIVDFNQIIPISYSYHIHEVYNYSMNRPYIEQYNLIVFLLEIIEALLSKESNEVEKYFKILMKYLQNSFHEIRNFIVHSLQDLHKRMNQYFPLGCFLLMYSLDTIVQGAEYEFFRVVSEENIVITENELNLILKYSLYYFYKQIHCECFHEILSKNILKNGKAAGKWGEETYRTIIDKFCQMNIPSLHNSNNYVLNPRPPNKQKVTHSLGLKRKEMLKYREYYSYKKVLALLKQINDKQFLMKYRDYVWSAISKLQKQVNRKTQAIQYLKSLFAQIKQALQNVHETEPMDAIVRSILINRSKLTMNSIVEEQENQSEERIEEEQEEEEEQKQESIGKKSQENENEFLREFTPDQVIPTPEIFKSPNLLLPFSQDEDNSPNPLFLVDSYFEQYELAYLRTIREKYKHIINRCVQIYHSICFKKSSKTLDEILVIFLFEIGLKKFVNTDEAEILFVKSKILHTTEYQIIEEFLIQLSFVIFGFKNNRRVNITCVQSLMTFLEEQFKTKEEEGKVEKPLSTAFSIGKNLQFDYRVSKLIQNQQNQSYLVCFNVLSEVFMDHMGFHLMEPLTLMVNQVIGGPSQLGSNVLDEEIEELEKELGQSSINQEAKAKSMKKLFKSKGLLKSVQSSTDKTLVKRIDPIILKNRISRRKTQLETELKKYKKSIP